MNNDSLTNQFKAIYEKEADPIFRFCLVRVSDREQAIDLTQETFTRLWKKLREGSEMPNAKSFVFTIAHNLIIDWYRKKKSLSLESVMEDESGEYREPADEEHAHVMASAEGRYLLSKISEIGPSYRHAVYLRFVEGLSPPEIAEIIGVTANAASVRINRGLEELRKITGYNENLVRDKDPIRESQEK